MKLYSNGSGSICKQEFQQVNRAALSIRNLSNHGQAFTEAEVLHVLPSDVDSAITIHTSATWVLP